MINIEIKRRQMPKVYFVIFKFAYMYNCEPYNRIVENLVALTCAENRLIFNSLIDYKNDIYGNVVFYYVPGHLDKDSLSNYMDFLWDGFNVVQNAVPFLVYELAMNPDIQTNLFKEISDTQKTHGENINYDNLSKLKYLDMVLSESLRRWSPVQFRREILSKSDTLDGLRHVTVRLEAGDSVWIPTHALHMDEKYFPNSERFDPERFNDQNKSKIKENVFQPYGIHGSK